MGVIENSNRYGIEINTALSTEISNKLSLFFLINL